MSDDGRERIGKISPLENGERGASLAAILDSAAILGFPDHVAHKIMIEAKYVGMCIQSGDLNIGDVNVDIQKLVSGFIERSVVGDRVNAGPYDLACLEDLVISFLKSL